MLSPLDVAPPNDDVYMLFHWPLRARGRLSGPLDVAPEISLAYEFLDLIPDIMTFLRVVIVVLVKMAILCLVLEFLGSLHGVGSSGKMILVDRAAFSRPLEATPGISLRGVSCNLRVSLPPMPRQSCTSWRARASRARLLVVA
ncbi:hypothetical protein B296_00036133 [Ensete ventricosum]|uniref:Uncharacterized protein n=1 Tax=Ensete ventricosum TaxID=4639 RepID=A0A426ZHB4_ENSVE|nr:hypothetical protein B296_00036133 [Ensete ventricosum]